MTMIVGYIWGKRYTRVEVLSVIVLTLGVIMAAMADAQSKVCTPCSWKPSLQIHDTNLKEQNDLYIA